MSSSPTRPGAQAAESRQDVVVDSVLAYSEHVTAYTSANAALVGEQLTAFAAQLQPGSSILDAGCGPGRDLARFVELGHHPTGIDLNADFVAVARQHAPAVHGDLRSLIFGAGTFDAVWASAALVHLPVEDCKTALSELARVSRSGAPAWISVKHAGTTGWVDTPHGRRWFQMWEQAAFAQACTDAGWRVTRTDVDDVFVAVHATRV